MLRYLNNITDLIVQVGGWSLLGASMLVTYDVITRKVFNVSIAGADEISGYVFAVSTACAYSYALITRANIRIDLVYNLVPNKLKRFLDFLSMAFLASFLCVIAYFSYDLVADAIRYGSKSITPLQTPLAIPQTLWFAALCFAIFTAVSLMILALAAALRGDGKAVESLIGIPTLSEEIEQEMGHAEQAVAQSSKSANSNPSEEG